MTTVQASIPDDLALQAGDKLHLEAVVLMDGSFLVKRVVREPESNTPHGMSLTEWVKSYSGTLRLDEGETREVLRDAYL